jgi:2,4-dienoyl-CoA reductase-like NADH-dependent reductase (Old Yellow Enzyme family)
MAPMTRSRSPDDVADTTIALYYAQRATAGLIVSEGTPISRERQGYLFNPGIYTPEQIAGWRLTTQSVHALGGHIFAQLWHVGRVSHTSIQHDDLAPVGASTQRIALSELPRHFKRHNLLSTASGQVFNWSAWRFIKAGDRVDAEAIRQYVSMASRDNSTGRPRHLYEKEIQYTDIGPFAECNGSNRPTEYDNVELK